MLVSSMVASLKHHTSLSLVALALTLLPFERSLDADGEPQVALQWCKKHVNDANREVKTVSYVRVESIQSKKIDSRGARPLYSARLCQLRFQINVQVSLNAGELVLLAIFF